MAVVHAMMTVMFLSVMPSSFMVIAALHMPMALSHRPAHARLALGSHRRLAAAQFLRTALDLCYPRGIGALPDAALRRLRERSGGAENQRQDGKRDSVHLHVDLSLITMAC
jgi:hypothetical protein